MKPQRAIGKCLTDLTDTETKCLKLLSILFPGLGRVVGYKDQSLALKKQ